MHILVAAFAYNEMKYLPAMVKYYRDRQGLDLLILDNYSDDGTYEWLVENGITTGRVDTGEMFRLDVLQQALNNAIRVISPDWVLYVGIDFYYGFPISIREVIQRAMEDDCNLISVQHWDAYNTGEEHKVPLQNHYYYMQRRGRLKMIGRYNDSFRIFADEVVLDNPREYHSEGIGVNYGMCKTAVEREVIFNRRCRAWEVGMHSGWGVHYIPAQKRQWIWPREEMIDIRTRPEFELIKSFIL